MARKSRNNLVVQKPKPEQFIAGVYLRLSVEDEGNNSIQSQQWIIEEYLKKYTDIYTFRFYIDNGVSSFNLVRPEFDKMMTDIRHGVINCIIVKDISRFGRSYIESADYIEKIFPFMNVRFISILENYDSLLNSSENIAIILKTLINNAYSWDISEKVRSVIQNKQQDGSYVPAKLPYGYKKENTTHGVKWVIDKEKAAIVLKIFSYAADKMSSYKIAEELNKNSIRSPNGRLWTVGAVGRIIRNRVYIGEFITRKTMTELTSIRSIKKVELEEQLVFKEHHIPVISCDLFEKAQENRNIRLIKSISKDEIPDFFMGKLFCGKCGRKMKRKIYRGKNETIYYICPTYEEVKGSCGKNRINLDKLKDDVFEELKMEIDDALSLNKTLADEMNTFKYKLRLRYIEDKLSFLRSEIDKHNRLKIKAFEDYAVLSGFKKDDYINKFRYEYQYVNHLQDSFCDIIKIKEAEDCRIERIKKEIEYFLIYNDKFELTVDMVEKQIKKILISEGITKVVWSGFKYKG